MAHRQEDISKLQSFIGRIDTELTMILQHLQWDRKELLEGKDMVVCKYDENHRVPKDSIEKHEQQCLVYNHGYSTEDVMLPEPLDANVNTLVKLNKTEINHIINNAAHREPSFKRGVSSTQGTESAEPEPMTLGRLQAGYTQDERRAVHDAVVAAAPFCHDLSDLALPSENGETSTCTKQKSRVEILAELRDMKRRRTKYRVAAKTRNYSDLLRDVIKTQMEVYAEVKKDNMSLPDTTDRRQEDKYCSPKYPRETSNRSTTDESGKHNHRKLKSAESKDRHSEDNNESSHKRRRNNDLVHYPDPREKKYREDKYNDKHSSSKRSMVLGFDEPRDLDRKDYDGRKYEEKYDRNEKPGYKRKFTHADLHDIKSECDDNQSKYREDDDRRSSRQRNTFDETYHKSERSHHRSNEYKDKRRYEGSISKESLTYENRKEKNNPSRKYSSSKDRKYESKQYNDSCDYERRKHDRYSEHRK